MSRTINISDTAVQEAAGRLASLAAMVRLNGEIQVADDIDTVLAALAFSRSGWQQRLRRDMPDI